MLITQGSIWPPPGYDVMRDRWLSWAAWWSGDPTALRINAPLTAPGGYWSRRTPGGPAMHLPLAADLARTSAELIAGDTPRLDWSSDAEQAAWEKYAREIGWANTLLEGLETDAALGGVYLRPAWDDTIAPHALPTTVRTDEALPQFKFGHLQSVTFVVELPPPDGWEHQRKGDVWRHLEHHEPGQIRHELWYGSTTNVGRAIPLAEHPATTDLPDHIDTSGIRPGLLVEYIPNDLPQPLARIPLGRSVFQGVETELDALDEAWDSWMRDIRLGKARILAAREVLDNVPTGTQRGKPGLLARFTRADGTTPAKAFDTDAEIFTPLPGLEPDGPDGKQAPITPVQFQIRYEAHARTTAELVEQITGRAGYAPQTMGMHVDGQLSGTAIRRREHRSLRTRDRQRRYARQHLERFAETLSLINAAKFGAPSVQEGPSLTWRETEGNDPAETAQTITALRNANAASTETVVQMAHPEWDDKQVADEVAKIAGENPAAPDPFAPADNSGSPV